MTVVVVQRIGALFNDYRRLKRVFSALLRQGQHTVSIGQLVQLVEDGTTDVVSLPQADLDSDSLSSDNSAVPLSQPDLASGSNSLLLDLSAGVSKDPMPSPVRPGLSNQTPHTSEASYSDMSTCTQSTDLGVSQRSEPPSVVSSQLSEPYSVASSRSQSTDYGIYYRRMALSLELEILQAEAEDLRIKSNG